MKTAWLIALMALSVGAVGVLAVWDEAQEAAATLDDFAREQTTLAAVAGAGLRTQLGGVRRDALAAAAELAAGHGVPPSIANNYVVLRVRAADAAPLAESPDWGAMRLSVPIPDGRVVDLLAPLARLLPGDPALEGADSLVLLLPPHDDTFRRSDGRPVAAEPLRRAVDAGQTTARLTRAEAAALGLPARTAVAGVGLVNASPLGRWAVVVIASASRVRDRQARARWRLLLGVLVAAGLVVAFGGATLRTQRKELRLAQALAVADLEHGRDEQLARENRAATMLTLAAGVAHEVSTPLSVIAGRAEQLAERPGIDERSKRAAQLILEQSDRIREVVRGFLRLARGDQPIMARVEPAAVVAAATALVEHRFDKAGVELAARVDDDLPHVRGDARLLEQAVVNLLLNACDACARGGRVEVCAERTRDAVVFAVVDDGTGISAKDAARVIEPFFSTKSSDQGSGLGLAIANEIAKIHRGTLALEPRAPHGTRAVISVATEGSENVA